jgi:hypothetical protein
MPAVWEYKEMKHLILWLSVPCWMSFHTKKVHCYHGPESQNYDIEHKNHNLRNNQNHWAIRDQSLMSFAKSQKNQYPVPGDLFHHKTTSQLLLALVFWWYWDLNSGPSPWATPPALLVMGSFKIGSWEPFAQAGLEPQSS